MQDLRDRALEGKVFLWILQIKDYDKLKDLLNYPGKDSSFKFPVLPVDYNRTDRWIDRLIKTLGID